MQLKPITAIIVLLLVVASLSIAGCTTTTTTNTQNQANITAYPTAGKRSELLQAIVAEENETAGRSWEGYKVTWLNNTEVNIYGKSNGSYVIYTENYTFIHFPTVTAATAYFDSNRPAYNFTKPAQVPDTGLYLNAVGNQHPTILKAVTKIGTNNTDYMLEQIDALIIDESMHSENINQA